jgi:hypothetical protein
VRDCFELPVDASGRRLYVHEYSLRVLAFDPALTRARVAYAMTGVRAMRVAAHHIESATAVGALDPALAAATADELRLTLLSPIEVLLRETVETGVSHARGRSAHDYRLLADGESIYTVCHENGYWTFATTPAAAIRMYDDDEPLGRLYARLRSGVGPTDLTMVRGAHLAAVGSPRPSRRQRLAAANLSPACLVLDPRAGADHADDVRQVLDRLFDADNRDADASVVCDLIRVLTPMTDAGAGNGHEDTSRPCGAEDDLNTHDDLRDPEALLCPC